MKVLLSLIILLVILFCGCESDSSGTYDTGGGGATFSTGGGPTSSSTSSTTANTTLHIENDPVTIDVQTTHTTSVP